MFFLKRLTGKLKEMIHKVLIKSQSQENPKAYQTYTFIRNLASHRTAHLCYKTAIFECLLLVARELSSK